MQEKQIRPCKVAVHTGIVRKKKAPICQYCSKHPMTVEHCLTDRMSERAVERQKLKLLETLGEILGNNCDVMKPLKKMNVRDKILITMTVPHGL